MKDQLPLIVLLIHIAANNRSVTLYSTLSRTKIKDVVMNLSGNKMVYQITATGAQNVAMNRREIKFPDPIVVASVQNVKTVSTKVCLVATK